MPLYEYRCVACGHRFEVLQRVGDDATGITCPRCDEARVERQLSTFAARGASASASGDAFAGCGRPACGTGFT
jgi:putative FmdB family regulatory protein